MRYYIYGMKAAVLIIFILVAQVLADSPHMYFDGDDPEAYETSVDSMPIHTEESLDSLRQEDLLNGSCQSLKEATTSKGDFGLGFSVGFGKNEGDDIRYEDIYHKGGETAGGVAPYITYGYPVFDNSDHRIIPTVKLCYYSGSSGDESIPAEDDTQKQFFYSLGIRYEDSNPCSPPPSTTFS